MFTLPKARRSPDVRWWLICLAAVTISVGSVVAEEPPTVFAPGVISGPAHDAAPAFGPDGKTVYFGRSNAVLGAILVSSLGEDGCWQEPKVAPFSGTWLDIEPAMAPDGSYLVFVSNRPAASGGKPIEAFYNGKSQPGGNLWRVERQGEGWGEPVRLPERINRSGSIFAPCVVADGSLYFMEAVGEKHRFRLFRSQWQAGEYQAPQPVAFSDGSETDVDPAVAPDESFAVFGSGRKPAQGMDLFIVFKDHNGSWQTPQHLGTVINSPGSDAEARLSPDLKTLYFSSERVMPIVHPRTPEETRADLRRMQEWDNGNYNIWQTPLASLLAKYAPPGTAHARLKKLPAPVIFEPGVISGPANDGAPTFSPDGRTLYFERSNANSAVIMESRLENGSWSHPEVASFSGPSSDQQPCISPDGRYLIYASSRARPISAEKGTRAELVTHLWRVDKTPSGWSDPVRLPDAVNISKRVFKPSIAANGDLFFMSDESPGDPVPKWRLYQAAYVNGAYAPAQPLSFSDGTFPDVDPGVAPDQSYIIFSSKGRRAPDDQEHLFIAFRQGATWGPVEPLRYEGDNLPGDDGEAQIGPDGKTLYFTSSRSQPIDRSRSRAEMLENVARMEAWDNGNNNIWTLPLEPYLSAKPPSL